MLLKRRPPRQWPTAVTLRLQVRATEAQELEDEAEKRRKRIEAWQALKRKQADDEAQANGAYACSPASPAIQAHSSQCYRSVRATASPPIRFVEVCR